MTELAYMVREDWAQEGTAMEKQSERIRGWLGPQPYVVATGDLKQYGSHESADHEFVEYLTQGSNRQIVIEFSRLKEFREAGRRLNLPLVAVHPHEAGDCHVLQDVVQADSVGKLFVIVWHGDDMVRRWLDGFDAINLDPDATTGSAPDELQIAAGRCWVDEQYNGLGHGNGKSAVVQLLRAFTLDGYPLDADTWLRAFFAAGGSFGHAADLERLIKEMQRGVRHRIEPRYRDDIIEVLRERAAQ